VTYLYGFIRSSAPLPPLEGIEPGTRVFAVVCGDLACAVSPVPAAAYRETGKGRGEDWIAPRALRHHDVLIALHRATTVLPLRFGSLCDREDDVRALIADRRDGLLVALSTLDGRDEWTLRIAADPAAIETRCQRESPALASLRARESSLPAGQAYFVRKQRMNATAALVLDTIAAVEDAILERISPFARPTIRGRRAARAFAETALLVDRVDLAALKGVLARVEAEYAWCGLRTALVGPWPPYSFAPAPGIELGRE
jgi:hypothetical protein